MIRQAVIQFLPLALVVILGVSACQIPRAVEPGVQSGAVADSATTGPYQVVRVIDGDTLVIDQEGTEQRVRLIGVNTPETVDPDRPTQCYGVEASDYAKSRLEGTQVHVETDPTQGQFDKYGRLLAYIWTEDGDLFNLQLIDAGYGTEYTYRLPYAYQTAFQTSEAQARRNMTGLWAACN